MILYDYYSVKDADDFQINLLHGLSIGASCGLLYDRFCILASFLSEQVVVLTVGTGSSGHCRNSQYCPRMLGNASRCIGGADVLV